MINKINSIQCGSNKFSNSVLVNKQSQNINKDTYTNIDKNETLENSEIIKKIQSEIEKCQSIVIKMIKGDNITHQETELINKYPDIKQMVEDCKKDNDKLKEILKGCKTENEARKVLSETIKDITNMVKNGVISEIKGKIKIVLVKDIEQQVNKYNEQIEKDLNKIQNITEKIIKGEKINKAEENFINEKYPSVKNLIKDALDNNEVLNNQIKNLKTEEQKQNLLLKTIKDTKNNFDNGTLSKLEAKIKLSALKVLEKSLEEENRQLKKALIISLKIIKGNELNKSENKFISEKFPDIKEFAQQVYKEYEIFKIQINLCSTNENKVDITNKIIDNITNLFGKDISFEIQENIKEEAIKSIREYEKNKWNDYINHYLYFFLRQLQGNKGISIAAVVGIIIGSIIIFNL